MLNYRFALALAFIVGPLPASALDHFRLDDASALISSNPQDVTAGQGGEDNHDQISELGGRQPNALLSLPGFLPHSQCQATLSLENFLPNPNGWASWLLSHSTSPSIVVPTVTANAVTAPDGSLTAASVALPTVTGANGYSFIDESIGSTTIAGQFPYTYTIWAQSPASNAANGTAYIFELAGSLTNAYYIRTPIPNDGRWHQLTVQQPGSYAASGSTAYFGVGIDLRATSGFGGVNGMAASTGPITVNVWRAQVFGGYHGELYPYQSGSGSANNVVVPCPSSISWRNFSRLSPLATNPGITWGGTIGGSASTSVANPVGQGLLVNGTYYSVGPYSTTANGQFAIWQHLAQWVSNDAVNWTLSGATQPVVDFTTNTVLGSFLLHSVYIPGGCTVSATPYAYCFAFSAADNNSTATAQAVYVAYSNTITGPYTVYGSPTPVVATSGGPSGTNSPTLPSIIQDGSTNYMYLAENNQSGTFMNIYTCPTSGDQVTCWTFAGRAMQPATTADWDYGASNFVLDPWVIKNKCGFYEYFYTVGVSSYAYQVIGYQIGASPLGPWFKYPGAIIPKSSALYVEFGGHSSLFRIYIGCVRQWSVHRLLDWFPQ